jgi:uncharacterized membrane protein YdjX (TVP38/TMEM64 family)
MIIVCAVGCSVDLGSYMLGSWIGMLPGTYAVSATVRWSDVQLLILGLILVNVAACS